MEEKVLVGVGASLLVLVFLSKVISYATKPRVKLPPGPWTLPLIGSIHHLVSWSESMHSVMRKLAWKHGPVMQLWFGEVALLVASSPEAAQEILKNQDLTFADRHMTSTTAVFSFDGRDIVMGPYGERWRQLRKMMTQELLTAPRVRSFRRIRQEEVARLVGEVSAAAAAGAAVNLTEMGAKLINDIVLRCSVGSRCKYSEEYLEALHAMARETSGLSVADLFPSSKLASMVATVPRKALANRKKMERIIEQIIQERKDQINADMMSGNVGDQAAAESKSCSLDVLLRLQKESTTPLPVTNEVILVLLMDIFAGGSETSSTTLTWTLAELIRSPRIMAKAQAEMRQAFQGKDTITEDDISQLSYLKMVIKESLRLHCPAPFLIPRKCRETCKIMGYDVPKGTAVFVNVWSICRDSKYWKDAEEFKPERFENNNIEYKGSNFEYLPFGSGRRICPGINLGLANVEVALANLLYHFDWKLPNGMLHKDLDIREARGLIAAKRTDLNVCPVTHIASS